MFGSYAYGSAAVDDPRRFEQEYEDSLTDSEREELSLFASQPLSDDAIDALYLDLAVAA